MYVKYNINTVYHILVYLQQNEVIEYCMSMSPANVIFEAVVAYCACLASKFVSKKEIE